MPTLTGTTWLTSTGKLILHIKNAYERSCCMKSWVVDAETDVLISSAWELRKL